MLLSHCANRAVEAAVILVANHLDTVGRKDSNSAFRRSNTTNSLETVLEVVEHYLLHHTQVVSKVLVVHYPVRRTQVVSKAVQQTADSNNPDRSKLEGNNKAAGNIQKTERQRKHQLPHAIPQNVHRQSVLPQNVPHDL
jgi:hypothetical protein